MINDEEMSMKTITEGIKKEKEKKKNLFSLVLLKKKNTKGFLYKTKQKHKKNPK